MCRILCAKKAEIEVAARAVGAAEALFAAAATAVLLSGCVGGQSDGAFVISRITYTHVLRKSRELRAAQPLKAGKQSLTRT